MKSSSAATADSAFKNKKREAAGGVAYGTTEEVQARIYVFQPEYPGAEIQRVRTYASLAVEECEPDYATE
jgi:hypothetical protein